MSPFKDKKITLRVPHNVYHELKRAAEGRGATIEAEVLARICQSFQKRPDELLLQRLAIGMDELLQRAPQPQHPGDDKATTKNSAGP